MFPNLQKLGSPSPTLHESLQLPLRAIEHLPEDCLLVFNDSKVIPARLRFKKESGAVIEIFLLNPSTHNANHFSNDTSKDSNTIKQEYWVCTIGNLKRWNSNLILKQQKNGVELLARLVDREKSIVQFSWKSKLVWN